MVQNPSSNPASGRETYTQTTVQTVHAETTPTYPHFPLVPHFIFSYPHPSFCVPAVCLLTQVWSLIIVLLSVSKQDTLHCWYLSTSRMSMQGLDWPPLSWFTCGTFVFWTGRTSPTTLAPERAQSAQRDEQVRRARERKGEGERESTRLSQGESRLIYSCYRSQLSNFSQFPM